MQQQLALPILQQHSPIGRPDPDAVAMHSRPGVDYFDLGVRSILNRCSSPRLPFAWTINPYRGCELGCTYCYARYTHSFFDLDRWQDFETKIFVKRGAADSLRRKLRKLALHGQPIAIGTATDPYQPAERRFGVTRSLLECFLQAEGLDLSITTKSPLILADLELLKVLDLRHSVTVNISLTTVDNSLARRLEPNAPGPEARLRTLGKLAEQGLTTQVFAMPIMPGINDDPATLAPMMRSARDAGATDVVGAPLFLRRVARVRFFGWLEDEYPHLVTRYRRLFARGDYMGRSDRRALLSIFKTLRFEMGFPRVRAGRG